MSLKKSHYPILKSLSLKFYVLITFERCITRRQFYAKIFFHILTHNCANFSQRNLMAFKIFDESRTGPIVLLIKELSLTRPKANAGLTHYLDCNSIQNKLKREIGTSGIFYNENNKHEFGNILIDAEVVNHSKTMLEGGFGLLFYLTIFHAFIYFRNLSHKL